MIDHTAHSGAPRVLVINAGSSSIKFALYEGTEIRVPRARGTLDRIGHSDSSLSVFASTGVPAQHRPIDGVNHSRAASALIEWLVDSNCLAAITAIGHRVVHGGSEYTTPALITDELVRVLCRISRYSPEHLPAQIELIDLFRRQRPDIPQVACFDTAFHRDMPRVAQLLPIPRRFDEKGIRRFGFHGLSYAFLMEELERVAGKDAAMGRVILAHLGNGSSLAAVHEGKSVDTTMAFTPAAGIPMSTRSGDLDPGLGWYLAQTENMSAEQFHRMVNHESGLLGVSETTADMRDLLAREATDVRAAEAVALYCYCITKSIGALAAALGGVDTLIFSGGIGENSATIRQRVCDRLGFLGPGLDIRTMRSDEEMMIARATRRILEERQ